MENVQYDPAIIQKFANKLYSQARDIILLSTVLGLVVGGGLGYAVAKDARRDQALYIVIGAAFFGFIGYAAGTSKALSLRVQAQTALCQVMIENNTRTTATFPPPPPPPVG